MIDDLLGQLIFDENHEWFQGTYPVGEGVVEFYLDLEDGEDVSPALARAREVLPRLADYSDAAKDEAVLKLLPLKNSNWLGEGESFISVDEFRNRLQLQSIQFDSDKSCTFFYGDSDLFWGHTIEIDMEADGLFRHANISG